MAAVLDLLRVLYEPDVVYARVRERPRVLVPFIALAVVLAVLAVYLKPYYVAAFRGTLAQLTAEQAARAPNPETQATLAAVFVPINLLIALAIGAGLLWIMASLTATEARYRVLFSVLTHAFSTYVLFNLATALVVSLRGVESVASMWDLFPPLGLNLLVPGMEGYLAIVLNGINPFSVLGVWVTGTGVAVTHGTSRGSGYLTASIAYLVALLLFSGIVAIQLP